MLSRQGYGVWIGFEVVIGFSSCDCDCRLIPKKTEGDLGDLMT